MSKASRHSRKQFTEDENSDGVKPYPVASPSNNLSGIDGTCATVITDQQIEMNPSLYVQLGEQPLSPTKGQGNLTDSECNTPEKNQASRA